MEMLEEARLPYPDLYELLNLRAATYEKVGELGEAAREAKHMIRLDKKSAAGYLRAGKVMCLMGKWEKALEVYRSGVGRVPEQDPQRPVSTFSVLSGFRNVWANIGSTCGRFWWGFVRRLE